MKWNGGGGEEIPLVGEVIIITVLLTVALLLVLRSRGRYSSRSHQGRMLNNIWWEQRVEERASESPREEKLLFVAAALQARPGQAGVGYRRQGSGVVKQGQERREAAGGGGNGSEKVGRAVGRCTISSS